MTIDKRFWAKVEIVHDQSSCWEWTGARMPRGYGHLHREGHHLAHRYAYTLAYGEIPAGMSIDHICHNPPCVRPSHLRAITQKQNVEHRRGSNTNSATGVRGVFPDNRRGGYRASVTHHRKPYEIGHFETIEEAAEAVRLKRLELFTHSDADR